VYFDLGEHTLGFYVLHGRGRCSGAEVAVPSAAIWEVARRCLAIFGHLLMGDMQGPAEVTSAGAALKALMTRMIGRIGASLHSLRVSSSCRPAFGRWPAASLGGMAGE
jgi:hypothetical protein